MRYLILILLSSFVLISSAQVDKKSICKISDNRLIFLLDSKWSAEEKFEISVSYDLDSILLEKAFLLIPEIFHDSTEWQVKKIDDHLIELSKDLNISTLESIDTYTKLEIDIGKLIFHQFIKNNTRNYGVNSFKNEKAFQYKDSFALFYLQGFSNARKVYISGNFNEWSTMKDAMQYVDSGWIIKLKLSPNKYTYKFIVDGNWITDPGNENKEQNEHGTFNSVVYCHNHIFKLDGYTDKKKLIVTGTFNNWDTKNFKMQKTATGWELRMFLEEGTYTYKFIVNKEWMIDSLNPLVREDGKGNLNSVLELGDKHTFNLVGYRNAANVFLAGSFNDWNPYELKMEQTDEGWRYSYVLAPGIYEYKFIVDGTWMTDRSNVYTKGPVYATNSVLIFKPNHTFTLKAFNDKKNVAVTGSFNGWDPKGYSMKFIEGKWSFPVYLETGKHLYKFIIDGEWILDPDNTLWEENEHGTGNSVLWMR